MKLQANNEVCKSAKSAGNLILEIRF